MPTTPEQPGASKRPAGTDGMGRTAQAGRATQDPEIGATSPAATTPAIRLKLAQIQVLCIAYSAAVDDEARERILVEIIAAALTAGDILKAEAKQHA